MSKIIQHQVELFRDETHEQEEAWKQEHDKAMLCYDVQETTSHGLYVGSRIEKHHAEWNDAVASGTFPFSPQHQASLKEVIDLWRDAAGRLLALIERVKQFTGMAVAGEEDLKKMVARPLFARRDMTRADFVSLNRRFPGRPEYYDRGSPQSAMG